MTPAELNDALDTLEAQFANLRRDLLEKPGALKEFFSVVEAIERRASHGQEVLIWERVANIMRAAGLSGPLPNL